MSIVTTTRRPFALPRPAVTLATSRNTAVLKIAANGVEYQATLELDGRNRAAPTEIAAMLERIAGYIRRDAR